MAIIDDKLTESIIGSAYRVANTLGHGFLEKVYENALIHELSQSGLKAIPQYAMQVVYDNLIVGEFVADICVEEKVLVEVKAVQALANVHVAQCLNYLKASGYPVCLLINFGSPKIEVRHPPQSGWLDEWGCLKGSQSLTFL